MWSWKGSNREASEEATSIQVRDAGDLAQDGSSQGDEK